ncbi:hypothetical protein T439DRAFT_324900 [Meredithblackwellia eburnea MCA 4105]
MASEWNFIAGLVEDDGAGAGADTSTSAPSGPPAETRPISFSSAFSARPQKKKKKKSSALHYATSYQDQFPFQHSDQQQQQQQQPAAHQPYTDDMIALPPSHTHNTMVASTSAAAAANPFDLPVPVFDDQVLQSAALRALEQQHHAALQHTQQQDIQVPQQTDNIQQHQHTPPQPFQPSLNNSKSKRSRKKKTASATTKQTQPETKDDDEDVDDEILPFAKPAVMTKYRGRGRPRVLVPSTAIVSAPPPRTSKKSAKDQSAFEKSKKRREPEPVHAPDDEEIMRAAEVEFRKNELKRARDLEYRDRKAIPRPVVPRELLEGLDGELSAEVLRAVERGKDPKLIKRLLAKLATQKEQIQRAYDALNEELVKVQIEGSVLRNLKTSLTAEREMLRAGHLMGISTDN